MNTHGYGKFIHTLINDLPANNPITTDVVANALAAAFHIDVVNAKRITNVNMKRLADKGIVARIQKGVYGKVKMTPFGKLTPSSDEMITGLLLRDCDKTIGYIAGPTLLNAIGLCSWMPKERHIATNNYRRHLPASVPIRVYKPVIAITDENAPYLQAIEAFAVMDQYPVDTEKPIDILRGMLHKNHIDNEKLIWYARNHFGQKILLRTIDIALGGIEQ
jgi:hypothetical protein